MSYQFFKPPLIKARSNPCKVALTGVEWDVVDLIESIPQLEIFGFFDPFPHNQMKDIPNLGTDDAWQNIQKEEPLLKIILALDAPHARARLFSHYGQEALLTLISPYAYISPRSSVSIGAIIQRGATIMPHAVIGKGCKINVNATIHHESIIGNFCTLAPSALVLGRVILEDQVYVGAGAIIRQRCRIGKGSIIGAGAVVVTDVPPEVTVFGVPAKIKI